MNEEQLKVLEVALRIVYQGKQDLDLAWIHHETFTKLLEAGESNLGRRPLFACSETPLQGSATFRRKRDKSGTPRPIRRCSN